MNTMRTIHPYKMRTIFYTVNSKMLISCLNPNYQQKYFMKKIKDTETICIQ